MFPTSPSRANLRKRFEKFRDNVSAYRDLADKKRLNEERLFDVKREISERRYGSRNQQLRNLEAEQGEISKDLSRITGQVEDKQPQLQREYGELHPYISELTDMPEKHLRYFYRDAFRADVPSIDAILQDLNTIIGKTESVNSVFCSRWWLYTHPAWWFLQLCQLGLRHRRSALALVGLILFGAVGFLANAVGLLDANYQLVCQRLAGIIPEDLMGCP